MDQRDPTPLDLIARSRARVRRALGCIVLGVVFGLLALAAIFPEKWRPAVASDIRAELAAGPVTEEELRRSLEARRRGLMMEQSRFSGWEDVRSNFRNLNWVATHALTLEALDRNPPRIVVALCYRDVLAAATGGAMTQFTLLIGADGEVVAWIESDW